MRSGSIEEEVSPHTSRLGIKVCRKFSWAVELIVELSVLRKISVTLAQCRAYAWLRLCCNSDVLFQRNSRPKRKGDKFVLIVIDTIQCTYAGATRCGINSEYVDIFPGGMVAAC